MDKYGSAHEWPHHGTPLWLHPDDALPPTVPARTSTRPSPPSHPATAPPARCAPWREGQAASLALGRRCGFAVEAQPVLVFVAARSITVTDSSGSGGALVVGEDDLTDRPGRRSGMWKPAEIETVHALARDRRTWTGL